MCRHLTSLLIVIVGMLCLVRTVVAAPPALRIDIVRGGGAVNHVSRPASVSPVVCVRDERGQPVPDALVVFTASVDGPRVEFIGSGSSVATVTVGSGLAVTSGIRPVGGNGSVQIQVMASKSGAFANAVLYQMNIGFGWETARDEELAVVLLDPRLRTDSKRAKGFEPAVRIEDGNGRPVAGATVTFLLRKRPAAAIVNGSIVTAVSNEFGEAIARFAQRPGRQEHELMVRPELGSRRATRYFPIPLSIPSQ